MNKFSDVRYDTMGNLVIIHGGGPSPVINASLYGAIKEAVSHTEIEKVYVAIGGTGGLIAKNLKDARSFTDEQLELLLQSPASAIGTSRDALEEKEYKEMVEVLKEFNIDMVLMNGGNGTMDTCGKLFMACEGTGIRVMGIPKTIDNDIAITDHSPGFGSAARYIAGTVAEVACDVRGLPIHICVIEALGRNAGWITAASALAEDSGFAPDLIYLPERDFDEEKFLEDVKKLIDEKGCGVVVASEGLHYADGTPIVEPIFKVGRATYFGDVSAHLCNLIIKKFGYKARSEKPGLCGRASIAWLSDIDSKEAQEAGRVAAKSVIEGESGKMVAFKRISNEPYKCETFLVDTKEVMMFERKMPDEFINAEGNGVTEAFKEWCRPLIGKPLPKLITFKEEN